MALYSTRRMGLQEKATRSQTGRAAAGLAQETGVAQPPKPGLNMQARDNAKAITTAGTQAAFNNQAQAAQLGLQQQKMWADNAARQQDNQFRWQQEQNRFGMDQENNARQWTEQALRERMAQESANSNARKMWLDDGQQRWNNSRMNTLDNRAADRDTWERGLQDDKFYQDEDRIQGLNAYQSGKNEQDAKRQAYNDGMRRSDRVYTERDMHYGAAETALGLAPGTFKAPGLGTGTPKAQEFLGKLQAIEKNPNSTSWTDQEKYDLAGHVSGVKKIESKYKDLPMPDTLDGMKLWLYSAKNPDDPMTKRIIANVSKTGSWNPNQKGQSYGAVQGSPQYSEPLPSMYGDPSIAPPGPRGLSGDPRLQQADALTQQMLATSGRPTPGLQSFFDAPGSRAANPYAPTQQDYGYVTDPYSTSRLRQPTSQFPQGSNERAAVADVYNPQMQRTNGAGYDPQSPEWQQKMADYSAMQAPSPGFMAPRANANLPEGYGIGLDSKGRGMLTNNPANFTPAYSAPAPPPSPYGEQSPVGQVFGDLSAATGNRANWNTGLQQGLPPQQQAMPPQQEEYKPLEHWYLPQQQAMPPQQEEIQQGRIPMTQRFPNDIMAPLADAVYDWSQQPSVPWGEWARNALVGDM